MASKRKGIRPEGVFVRQGPSTIPASYDAIRQMLIETSGDHYETGASFQQDLTFNFAAKYFAQKNVAFGKAQNIDEPFQRRQTLYQFGTVAF